MSTAVKRGGIAADTVWAVRVDDRVDEFFHVPHLIDGEPVMADQCGDCGFTGFIVQGPYVVHDPEELARQRLLFDDGSDDPLSPPCEARHRITLKSEKEVIF
jgi:hypothetical protein